MEAGERELRKAFEDVSNRNIKAILEHGNKTRKIVREVEAKVDKLEDTIRNFDDKIKVLEKLLSNIQQKVYVGGTT